MIDPIDSNNSLSKGKTNSTQNPTQDSAGEVGAENSKGKIEVGELEQTKDRKQRQRPKKDAA